MEKEFDETDREILEILQKDCSRTKKQVAHELGVPLTTVHNRIAKLEREGAITSYRAHLGWKRLGYGVSAFVQITVDYKTKDFSQEGAAKRIKALAGVENVAILAGTTDIIAKVRTKDTDGLNDFLLNHLRKIPGIDKTTTLVVLKEYE